MDPIITILIKKEMKNMHIIASHNFQHKDIIHSKIMSKNSIPYIIVSNSESIFNLANDCKRFNSLYSFKQIKYQCKDSYLITLG
jgi:hypothetical protein